MIQGSIIQSCQAIVHGLTKDHTMQNLLTIDTNAKTIKGQEYGFMTGILYMAPANISGHNTCAMAEVAQCAKACLYSAGRGAFNNVQQARIRKAKLYFSDRQAFMAQLVTDITKLVNKANKANMVPLVRLNGTSDIQWENVQFEHNGKLTTIFDVFPTVQFYDYTKISKRTDLPKNYDLTFSYSGVLGYQKYVRQAVSNGMRIAVVFRRRVDIPKKFLGLPCIDGDNSDIRHIEPKQTIVALYAKGKAKTDDTGFVVDSLKPVFALSHVA